MLKVLLDCDTGIDDSLALIYLAALHRAGEIELSAVTTSAGNTTALQAAFNSAFVLHHCGVTVPLAVGEMQPLVLDLVTTPETHGPKGLGYVLPPAVPINFDWISAWRKSVDRTIIIGPATNAASVDQVPGDCTLMGGAYLYRGNTTPTAEWNSWVDPHAAKAFFARNTATVCSLEVTERFVLTPEKLSLLIDALGNTPIAKHLPEMLRFYFEFHESQGEGYLAQIHDALTCMIALGTIDYQSIDVAVDVEASDSWLRGTTVADFRNHWNRPPNAHLVRDVDIEGAHRELQRAYALLGELY